MTYLTAHILAPLQDRYLETASLKVRATLHIWACGRTNHDTQRGRRDADMTFGAVQTSGYAPLRFLHELVQ